MIKRPSFRRRFAKLTAAPMFCLSLLFLANTAALIVVWVDVPRVSEAYRSAVQRDPSAPIAAGNAELEAFSVQVGLFLSRLQELLWLVFLLEFAVYLVSSGRGPRYTRAGIVAIACPPLRLAAPNPELQGQIWLPRFGWTRPNRELRDRLEKAFGLPMIMIALMILPVLLVEFGFTESISSQLWLRILLHAGTGIIWFAFACEFILMVSVARKKIQYCKDHWVDLAIILLPLVSFLRSLRLVRATRLAQVAKVQHLTKLGRTFRLRGLVFRALRAVLVFEVIYRLLGISPERRVRSLREKLAEKEREIDSLRQQIELLEQAITERALLAENGAAIGGDEDEAARSSTRRSTNR